MRVESVDTFYGDSHVLRDVTLGVAPGSFVSVLGRNGAGKTTLIKTIVNLHRARNGKIVFRGKDITNIPTHRIVRLGIGIVPQGRRIFRSLSVQEHLDIAARSRSRDNDNAWNLERIFGLFPPLDSRRKQRAETLSGGEQQMLAIARALVSNPDFILMDEPSDGLAPQLLNKLVNTLEDLKTRGLSMLLVEQNLALALRLSEFVYVLNKGSIVYESSPENLESDAIVKRRYLGV